MSSGVSIGGLSSSLRTGLGKRSISCPLGESTTIWLGPPNDTYTFPDRPNAMPMGSSNDPLCQKLVSVPGRPSGLIGSVQTCPAVTSQGAPPEEQLLGWKSVANM